MKKSILTIIGLLAFCTMSMATVIHTVSGAVINYDGTATQLTIDGTDIMFDYTSFSGISLSEPNFNVRCIITQGPPPAQDVLVLFSANQTIDTSNYNYWIDAYSGLGTHSPGQEPSGVHYLGLYTANGNLGWVKIDVDPGVSYTIVEYAYDDSGAPTFDAGSMTSNSIGIEEPNGQLNVEIIQDIQNRQIRIEIRESHFKTTILDMSGKVLHQSDSKMEISTQELASGYYIVSIESNTKSIRQKIWIP